MTYTNVTANKTDQNYTGFKPKISGYVKNAAGLGVYWVLVSANNGGGQNMTDENGFYQLTVPYDWSGQVTPSRTGWVFTPANLSFTNVTGDLSAQEFSGDYLGVTVKLDGGGDFTSIQSAIYFVYDGEEITVYPGRYYENNISVRKDIVLRSIDPNDPNIVAATIIDGQNDGRLILFGGETSSCKISGFTLTNGRSIKGGGIVGISTKATVANCRIVGNSADSYGGGLYQFDGLLVNCTISGNSARYGGGLCECRGTIKNCTISDNSSSAYGGGLYDCNATIDNCTISSNTANSTGGGLYDCDGNIKDSVITGNRSVNSSGAGLYGCDGTIENCIISGNTADNLGGGLYFCRGTIQNCTISGNSANYGGGLSRSFEGTIKNCIISDNTASQSGGGLYDCDDGILQSCVIADNSAAIFGGGLAYYDGAISDCNIQNNESSNHGGGLYRCSGDITGCLISGNTSPGQGGGLSYCNGTISDCNVSGNSAGLGGGFANCDGTISRCDLSGNSAYDGSAFQGCGGTISGCNASGNSANMDGTFSYCHGTISDCNVSGNSVTNYGGGFADCWATISRCHVWGNSARRGGGFYECHGEISNCVVARNSVTQYGCAFYDCDGAITNCDILGNSAAAHGGGLFFCDGVIKNCIVWNNTSSQIYHCSIPVYCCIENWTGEGVGNISSDPLLKADGYHLGSGSPCIEAGEPNFVHDSNETDVDGDPRVIRRVDMGADEFCTKEGAYIFVEDTPLYFDAIEDRSNPQPQSFDIWNFGIYTLHFSIDSDSEWLSVLPETGDVNLGNILISVMVDIDGLSYGDYSGTLTITDDDALNSPQTIPVELTVQGPVIATGSKEIYFECSQSSQPPVDQTLAISNTGGGTLNWQINIPSDCNWLSVKPVRGRSTDEVNEVTLSVDANGMDIGFYICELTISDPNAENSPQTVQVILELFTAGRVYVPSEFPTIQEAIDVTINGAEVIVEPGIYTGPGNCDIDFRGKAITVRSVDPNNPAVVAATIIEPNTLAIGFRFRKGEQADSVVDGLTIRRCIGRAAIDCYNSSPTIRNCIIEDNYHYDLPYYGGAGIACYESSPVISNCVIRNNYGGGLRCKVSDPTVRNCIFTANRGAYSGYYGDIGTSFGGGILSQGGDISVINCTFSGNVADVGGGICSFGSYAYINNMTISNCIFRDNDANDGPQIALKLDYKDNPSTVSVSYSDVQGGEVAVYVEPRCTLNWDDGNNLDIEPCFAVPGYWHTNDTPEDFNDDFWVNGDYHLRSQSGRWDPNSEIWYIDANTSPCIDAGEPNSDWTAELWPHGRRINIGAYGGTPEASMSLSDAGNIAELNRDDSIGYADIILFMGKWLYKSVLLSEDLDRNGFVNFADFAIFANNWEGTPGQASNPNPADGVRGVDPNADLNWTAGYGATSHDVYFGSSSLSFICNQAGTIFEPGTMTEGTVYYWRIDEVNTGGKTAGQVWSFTTFGPPPPPPLPPPPP